MSKEGPLWFPATTSSSSSCVQVRVTRYLNMQFSSQYDPRWGYTRWKRTSHLAKECLQILARVRKSDAENKIEMGWGSVPTYKKEEHCFDASVGDAVDNTEKAKRRYLAEYFFCLFYYRVQNANKYTEILIGWGDRSGPLYLLDILIKFGMPIYTKIIE